MEGGQARSCVWSRLAAGCAPLPCWHRGQLCLAGPHPWGVKHGGSCPPQVPITKLRRGFMALPTHNDTHTVTTDHPHITSHTPANTYSLSQEHTDSPHACTHNYTHTLTPKHTHTRSPFSIHTYNHTHTNHTYLHICNNSLIIHTHILSHM